MKKSTNSLFGDGEETIDTQEIETVGYFEEGAIADIKVSRGLFATPDSALELMWPHLKGLEITDSFLEPACGNGNIVRFLRGKGCGNVSFSDIEEHAGVPEGLEIVGIEDREMFRAEKYDWVITNPPFNMFDVFVSVGLKNARKGFAILAPLRYLAGIERKNTIFIPSPPNSLLINAGRVPFKCADGGTFNRIDTAWFVWNHSVPAGSQEIVWL